jgi:pilus assembly protein CpaB
MSLTWSTYRRSRVSSNLPRLVVLGIALCAGLAAAWLAAGSSQPVVQVVSAPAVRTVDIVVAQKALAPGSTIRAGDLQFQAWPADNVAPAMITRAMRPAAIQELEGFRVRGGIDAGEPVRSERVMKDKGGVLSTMLRPGYRAVAIAIDSRGATTAGGFILPNDHVDLIKVSRDESASSAKGSEVVMSQTLLRNVRVLAIGKTFQDPEAGEVASGETATLELDPSQAEAVVLAQRTGMLSLALRPQQDPAKPAAELEEDSRPVTVRSAFGTRRFMCNQGACSDSR